MLIIPGSSFIVPLHEMPQAATPLLLQWIPPGNFIIGSPPTEKGRIDDLGDFERQVQLTMSQGFWLSSCPVTQAQWARVMGINPSRFQGINLPVENVNWFEAMTFAGKLNEIFLEDLPNGYIFSLPTEAQWEYACRAGTSSRYYNGDSLDDLSKIAWYKENSLGKTWPVGKKEPNQWGLYDMLGNVAEWCFDAPSDYPLAPSLDWIGEGNGEVRAIRSGSWNTPVDSSAFRCACRLWVPPDSKRSWFGFRLCLQYLNLA